MADREQHLIDMHRRKMADLGRRVVEAVSQLGDDDVNWRPNEESNSIANLALHMAGNMDQRYLAGIGGMAVERDRDAEFNSRRSHTRGEVVDTLNRVFSDVDRILAGLTPADLDRPQQLHTGPATVLDALFLVATHISEHVGQILYIAKLRLGAGYRVLSTPHKKA